MYTFQVDSVVAKQDSSGQTLEIPEAFRRKAKVVPEAYGIAPDTQLLYAHNNGLIMALHIAYDEHRPIRLSPDHIWLAIAQGFAQHVDQHAEELRHHFVAHEGKKLLMVRRDGFLKGSADNDWAGCFAEFSDQIAEHIGKKRDLLVSNFTTTGPVEKIASEIVLMDAMKHYFEYGMSTTCGIPRITLLGETSDWESIELRAANLSEFGCQPWITAVLPVLREFTLASQGNPNQAFWQEFFKVSGGSGGPFVSGHVNRLFPYLLRGRNVLATVDDLSKVSRFGCPEPDEYPNGLSSVPFTWYYGTQEIPTQFLGGFVGAGQTAVRFRGTDKAEYEITPVVGWGVAEALNPK